MRRATLLTALALVVAGCGGDDGEPAGETAPESQAPTATAPPATDTATAPPATDTAGEPPTGGASPPGGGEDQPGGAGDEEGNRVPAVLTIGPRGELSPETVRVPAFLGIELTVASDDDAEHRVEVATAPPVRGSVAAGDSLVEQVPGQQPGEYDIRLDGERAATLVVGGDAGP